MRTRGVMRTSGVEDFGAAIGPQQQRQPDQERSVGVGHCAHLCERTLDDMGLESRDVVANDTNAVADTSSEAGFHSSIPEIKSEDRYGKQIAN